MKKILFLLAMVLIVSCEENEGTPREIRGNTEKSDFHVQFLFEVDGVKVYRFYDHSNYHYFTNTSGVSINVHYEYNPTTHLTETKTEEIYNY